MQKSTAERQGWAVIDGAGSAPSPWLDFPQTVIARSPFNKEQPVFFRFAKNDIQKALSLGRRQPILDAWSMIWGKPPPLPNISRLLPRLDACPLSSIQTAHACFRGVKRPVGEDDRGFDVVVMISRPRWMIASQPSLVCVGELVPVPNDVVFATYIKLDQPPVGRLGVAIDTTMIRGVITHWHFIEAEIVGDEILPVEHKERYRKRLW
jgi:hypothetical protein